MAPGSFRFDRFHLDPNDRRLLRDGTPVELNARYLDALALLVREQGRLVSRERFLDEVWRGVPVTDEALSQCIRTIRRRLGDDAARPRFIETVPKHGYRFIAAVTPAGPEPGSAVAGPAIPAPASASPDTGRRRLLLGGAGMLGGGAAGALGGLFYGFAGASGSLQSGAGGVSVVLVFIALTALVGLVGGAGVGVGIAAAGLAASRVRLWTVVGGALGGLVVGAVVKLLGLDAFNLLFGRSPGEITGAGEGALLGAVIGFGAGLGGSGARALRLRIAVASTALGGAAAGVLIALLGGRLMGGSLELVARRFPDSRLRLDPIGGLFGESGFGPISQAATAALEGALFSGFVVAAVLLARRALGEARS